MLNVLLFTVSDTPSKFFCFFFYKIHDYNVPNNFTTEPLNVIVLVVFPLVLKLTWVTSRLDLIKFLFTYKNSRLFGYTYIYKKTEKIKNDKK